MDVFSFFGQLAELIQTQFSLGNFSYSGCGFFLQNEATLTSGAGGGGDTSTAGAQPSMFVIAGRGETFISPSHTEKGKGDS